MPAIFTFWKEFTDVNCLKRPSHGKLKLANSCWQTQVGVCERHKNSRQTSFYLTPTVCKRVCRLFLCRSHTPIWVCQHEFADLSLLCEGRLKWHSVLRKMFCAHFVMFHKPPRFKLDTSFGSSYPCSSLPSLRIAIACWLSVAFFLGIRFATHIHQQTADQLVLSLAALWAGGVFLSEDLMVNSCVFHPGYSYSYCFNSFLRSAANTSLSLMFFKAVFTISARMSGVKVKWYAYWFGLCFVALCPC